MDYNYSEREKCDAVKSQIDNEKTSFLSHWQDLADYILPRRQQFQLSDNNKGEKRNQNIIDSTATTASRTLRSGMMSGVTSPARSWFRLGLKNKRSYRGVGVKIWLKEVEDVLRATFNSSNLYQVLPSVYGDMGTFGTGAMLVEQDTDLVMRFTSLPIGSYGIANDSKGRVRVFSRELRMTVRQVVEEFALDKATMKIDTSKLSTQVANLWETNQREAWIDVCHIIMPNDNYKQGNPFNQFKRYISYYYEMGSRDESDRMLRKTGYSYFPVLVPRWETAGQDVYGTDCPGMTCLGDVKQLQLGEKRAAQGIEKMIFPAMTGPTSLKGQKSSLLPGDTTYVDDRDNGRSGYRPAHDVSPSLLGPLETKQEQIRQRIRRAFFEDLFLMLANSSDAQKTATEIVERKEEKLIALGPVLEQIDQDLLDPLMEIAFIIHMELGLLPEAPEEIEGEELNVEYISIMAQAQKLQGIGGIERVVGFVGQLAGIGKAGAMDKLDEDEIVDIYADLVGVPVSIIRQKDAVDEIRRQAAEAQAAEQQQIQMGAAVDAAKSLSQTSTQPGSALSELIGG